MSNARIALTLTAVWIVGLIALFVTPFEFVIPTQLSLVVFWWWPIGGIDHIFEKRQAQQSQPPPPTG